MGDENEGVKVENNNLLMKSNIVMLVGWKQGKLAVVYMYDYHQ